MNVRRDVWPQMIYHEINNKLNLNQKEFKNINLIIIQEKYVV